MGNLWERDVHKTKQGFRGKTMRNKTTKIALALG
ncbi:cysteine ABC transporter substrate-binding protein, partial [Klebsiella pneumoniae]